MKRFGMNVLYDKSKIKRFNYKRFSPEDRIRLRKLRIKIAGLWLPEKEAEIKEWRKKVGINAFAELKCFAGLSREQKKEFFKQAYKFIRNIKAEERKKPADVIKSGQDKKEYYCFVLGINRNSKLADIKKRYRKLVQIHHPDHGGDSELFIKIKEAYEFLMK